MNIGGEYGSGDLRKLSRKADAALLLPSRDWMRKTLFEITTRKLLHIIN